MIRLHYSSRTEELLTALVRDVAEQRQVAGSPLEPLHLVVPNRAMERYVEMGLARGLGIAANVTFHRLQRFVGDWLAAALPEVRVLAGASIEGWLLDLLADADVLGAAELGPVRAYLSGAGGARDHVDLRRVQLALRLGRLFEEYSFSRPELLAAWRAGETLLGDTERAGVEAWQQVLWRGVRQRAEQAAGEEGPAACRSLDEVIALLAERTEPTPTPWPALFVFGVSYVARAFQSVFALLGRSTELHLYTFNPCQEFWEDVPAEDELRQRLRLPRRAARIGDARLVADEDPFELDMVGDSPMLRLWGRPGREHVRLLNELTECDFEARFSDPARGAETLLRRLQQDVLERAPEQEGAPGEARSDDSLTVRSCAGVRREVEMIADEIWRLVGQEPEPGREPLRFNDIAVIVNAADREQYLPHVQAVFAQAHDLPANVVDLPLAAASGVVEAALLLLDLPLGRFTRPDVLGVISHPAVTDSTEDFDPRLFAALCDELGIFHGIDARDHAGSYVGEGVLHFDQGLRRLALGAFVTDEADAPGRRVVVGEQRVLPAVVGRLSGDSAARFGLLVRSLAGDVRFAREAELSLTDWSHFVRRLLRAYLTPSVESEHAALRRCLAAVARLGERDTSAQPVSYRVAAELVRRELSGLTAGRGEYLADGVVVSSFQPMRAIPFRVIFIAGLGEGRFPASDRRETIDLRAVRRHAGDVSPAERDRYMFLETLLCAGDRLVLSYVGQDEHTGDDLPPSPVVQELLHIVERSYLPDARRLLVRGMPWRRHEVIGADEAAADSPPTVLPEAWREAAAQALGDQLRVHLRREGVDPAVLGDARWVRAELAGRADAFARGVLGLAPLPSPTTGWTERLASSAEPPRISLATLVRFLECPLQGWARAVLGLEQDDDAGAESVQDEPFAPAALEATRTLRDVYIGHWRGEGEREALYSEAVERLEARGRWSSGVLQQLRARHDEALFDGWDRATARLVATATDHQDPGAEALVGPYRLRLGPGFDQAGVDRVLASIELELPWGEGPAGTETMRTHLVGTVGPLLVSPPGTLSLDPQPFPGGSERARVRRWRLGLRAFVHHLALAAAGEWTEAGHAVSFCWGDGAVDGSLRFAPVAPDRAQQYLTVLVGEIMTQTHAILFPCEAVLRLASSFAGLTGEALVASAELVRDRWAGGSSRYGPAPRPLEQPLPAPAEALAMARRRFGLFFELAGVWRKPEGD